MPEIVRTIREALNRMMEEQRNVTGALPALPAEECGEHTVGSKATRGSGIGRSSCRSRVTTTEVKSGKSSPKRSKSGKLSKVNETEDEDDSEDSDDNYSDSDDSEDED
ncbi:hypothetical protein FGB62_9g02 [Gracilaria domingensis]|nr:hypothetical protein FGB62_9g02 [Gracilaria domingensis]